MSKDFRLLKTPSNLAMKACTGRASTISLSNLFWCLTTLVIKTKFFVSKINPPLFTLEPFLLVLSIHALVKSLFPSFLKAPFIRLKGWNLVSKEHSLLQVQQSQLSQPFFTVEPFQPSDQFCAPPLGLHCNTSMSCTRNPRTGYYVLSWELSRGRDFLPSTCLPSPSFVFLFLHVCLFTET